MSKELTTRDPRRPELTLVAIEKFLPFYEMVRLAQTPYCALPNDLASDDELRGDIARNSEQLAKFPAESHIERMDAAVRSALTVRTPAVVNKLITQMIGSFPNARPADPGSYVDAIIYDANDIELPDAVVASACLEIRRMQVFCPAIAEFLEIAEKHLQRARSIPRCLANIKQVRASYVDAIDTAESWLTLDADAW